MGLDLGWGLIFGDGTIAVFIRQGVVVPEENNIAYLYALLVRLFSNAILVSVRRVSLVRASCSRAE